MISEFVPKFHICSKYSHAWELKSKDLNIRPLFIYFLKYVLGIDLTFMFSMTCAVLVLIVVIGLLGFGYRYDPNRHTLQEKVSITDTGLLRRL